jgi:hypothetical protein
VVATAGICACDCGSLRNRTLSRCVLARARSAVCIAPALLLILRGHSRFGPMTGRSSSRIALGLGQQTTSCADDAAFTLPQCARLPQGSEQSSTRTALMIERSLRRCPLRLTMTARRQTPGFRDVPAIGCRQQCIAEQRMSMLRARSLPPAFAAYRRIGGDHLRPDPPRAFAKLAEAKASLAMR